MRTERSSSIISMAEYVITDDKIDEFTYLCKREGRQAQGRLAVSKFLGTSLSAPGDAVCPADR